MGVISAPGIYPHIDDSEYHRDPCPEPSLSSSIGKLLVTATPRHAWQQHPRLNTAHKPRNTADFDFGKVVHATLLGTGGAFKVLAFDSFRTDAARKARDACYAANITPMLAKDYEPVADIAEAVRIQLNYSEDASRAFLPGAGKAEVTIAWREQPDPKLPTVWCRARPDWLSDDGIMFDLKTTADNAGPEDWGRSAMFVYGYDFQAEFYRRGLRAITGREHPFLFIAVEKSPPYGIAVHGLTGEAQDAAAQDVDEAIRKWQWCTAKNVWPGYSSKTYYNEPPVWRSRLAEDRKMAGPITQAAMARSLLFQAPPDFDPKLLPIQLAAE